MTRIWGFSGVVARGCCEGLKSPEKVGKIRGIWRILENMLEIRLEMRKWKKNRIEEILVSNSSLVSGLSEASGVRFSWAEVSQKVRTSRNIPEKIRLLKAYWRPFWGGRSSSARPAHGASRGTVAARRGRAALAPRRLARGGPLRPGRDVLGDRAPKKELQ